MRRFKLVYLLFAIVLCGALLPARADTALFTDSTFNLTNYTTSTNVSGGASVTELAQCASCGNPGTALQIGMSFPGPVGTGSTADAVLVNNTVSYDPETQGDISSVSASVDKNLTLTSSSGGGDTFHPVIEQDSIFYVASIVGTGLTGPGTTGYETLSDADLAASDFVAYDFATNTYGTANPNFDGDTMLFGLAQISSSDGPAILTADYDNLSIDLAPVATPEPSSLLLLPIGLAGLIVGSRRRLAFNN